MLFLQVNIVLPGNNSVSFREVDFAMSAVVVADEECGRSIRVVVFAGGDISIDSTYLPVSMSVSMIIWCGKG